MGTISVPTIPPIGTMFTLPAGPINPVWYKYLNDERRFLLDIAPAPIFSPDTYGAIPDGKTDSTQFIQEAVTAAVKNGGGTIQFSAGTYITQAIYVPQGSGMINFTGAGLGSVVKRARGLPPNTGMFDIHGTQIGFSRFVIDGATLQSNGLQYNVGFNGINGNDPMAASLAGNTSIWIHGPSSQITVTEMVFQHAAGYSILADATSGNISDIDIYHSLFRNNRPTLFGVAQGQLIYGSWNGGILLKGDGRTTGSGSVSGTQISFCRFLRNTGNCIWTHNYGLNELCEDIVIIGNRFLDCGLDGVLMGVASGGAVCANVMRRIGYICTDDTSRSTPRWLQNLNATAIDSAAVVEGIPYCDNSLTSINGGCLDLDGHSQGSVKGNLCRVPFPNEADYAEDQIAISGPNNNGSYTYGVNTSNTYQQPYGGAYININGNTFINITGGAIRMYAARYSHASDNLIYSPDTPQAPPIQFGPIGTGQYQRCHDNYIHDNPIFYSPAAPVPAVLESDSISPFLATEKNYVYRNQPNGASGLAFEFQNSPNSGSFVSSEFPSSDNYIAVENGANNAISSPAGSAAPANPGLTVQILLAHTLQAGANTYAHLMGTALAIKKHTNPSANLGTGYAVGSVIELAWTATAWLDLSQ